MMIMFFPINPRPESAAQRWMWLCPLLAVMLAAGIFVVFGWNLWSALLAAVLLVCPVLFVWGVIKIWRPPKSWRN